MIDYDSDTERKMVEEILSEKHMSRILRRKGGGNKEQLVENVMELVALVYRNPDVPELHNVVVPDAKEDLFMYFKNEEWHIAPIGLFTQVLFLRLQTFFKRVQKPFEYYIGLDNADEEIRNDDPLRMLKHLDAFVNNDGGYGWSDAKLVTKKELTESIKLFLSTPLVPEDSGPHPQGTLESGRPLLEQTGNSRPGTTVCGSELEDFAESGEQLCHPSGVCDQEFSIPTIGSSTAHLPVFF